MAVEYGTIAVVPMGTWENSKDYDVGNLVELDGSSYVAKVKPPAGMLPTDTAYWQISAKGASKATVDIAGVVKPDGVTTEVDANASLSVKKATQSTVGIVKGSDDIKVGADGSIDVDTTFTQATELANIIAGEAIASVLGKVSKAIAITMSLDQNALLKNMLTSIDGNSSEKVPTQAYIHTLVERIGMGTELTAGANLTEVANELSSNLPYIDTSKKIKDGFANGTSWTATENCIVCGSIGFNSSAHGCYVSVNSITIFWVNNDAATNSFAPVCFAVRKGDAIKFVGYDNQVPILTNLYAFSTK